MVPIVEVTDEGFDLRFQVTRQEVDPRLVPYSTRHTLKDKMRVVRTPLALQLELMGHQNSNRVADEYGDGDPPIYLRQELERATKVEEWGQGV